MKPKVEYASSYRLVELMYDSSMVAYDKSTNRVVILNNGLRRLSKALVEYDNYWYGKHDFR